MEMIEDAVPKETLTGFEVTTKSAAALKAAVDTEASVQLISIPYQRPLLLLRLSMS